jgi:VWFA-related protein
MRHLLCVALGVALLAALPVAAQSRRPEYQILIDKDENGRERVVSGFLEEPNRKGLYITVQFRVVHPQDNSVAMDVSRDEIVIEEDGVPVTDLDISAPLTQNLTTVLAMDVSGSMKLHGKIEQARKAGTVFLGKLTDKANVGLILFDHQIPLNDPTRVLPPADNPANYRGQRERVGQLIAQAVPLGGTAYLDAGEESVQMLARLKGRRAVILMTDGVDTNSRITVDGVIKRARTAGIPIYTLGIGESVLQRPVRTVLVLDHSGSMRDKASDRDNRSKMEALHEAANRFVGMIRTGAQSTVLPFSTLVEMPGPFTSNKEDLRNRIKQLRPEGGTLVYDATYAAIETLATAESFDEAGLKTLQRKNAVVVLTDGKDEAPGSRHSPDAVIQRAREAGIPLHMLGLGRSKEINEAVMKRMAAETNGTYHHATSEDELVRIFEQLSVDIHDDGIDEEVLRKLAHETGGRYFPARDASQLQLLYEQVATELQSTYTVTFRSRRPSHDGTARGITITVMRGGVALSDSGKVAYQVHGVVVAEMSVPIYLVLLALLLALLALPAGLKRLLAPARSA